MLGGQLDVGGKMNFWSRNLTSQPPTATHLAEEEAATDFVPLHLTSGAQSAAAAQKIECATRQT